MPEPDECVKLLDEWIKQKKNIVYDENIKGPNNRQDVLENYTNVLEIFASKLITAIEKEDTKILNDLEWPDDLMECIKDMNIRTVILDRIESWFVRYPFVKSKLHLEELARENAGVN
jgi:hypothetical protein